MGIRVNGVEFWEFDELDEVEYEPLFRQFKVWVPYDFLSVSSDLEVQPISRRSDSAILFKPTTKTFKVEPRELNKNVGFNFKVLDGIFVEG